MAAKKNRGLMDREAEDEDELERTAEQRRKKPKFEDSSEEDEDDDQDAFENDGFIVGEDDDEDDDGGDRDRRDRARSPSPRKKKRRRREIEDDDELAEGDLLLLEEQGLSVKNRRKLTRLRKAAADDDDENAFRKELSALQDDEEEDEDDADERAAVDEDVDDFDEFDDFIDDGGRSRRRRKKQKEGGVSSDAVRAARSVFGDYDELEDRYGNSGDLNGSQPRQRGGFGDDEEDSKGSGDDEDDNEDRQRKSHKSKATANGADDSSQYSEDAEEKNLGFDLGDQKSRNRTRGKRTASPSQLDDTAVNGTTAVAARLSLGATPVLTAEDNVIIETDIPEYLQSHFGDRKDRSEEEISRESSWIYKHAFASDPVFAGRYNAEEVVNKIGIFLTYVYVEKLDVPFIALYRKDYIGPELLHPCGGDPVAEAIERGLPPILYAPPNQAGLARPRGFNSVFYDDFDESFSIEHLRGLVPGFDDGFGDWSSLWLVLDWDKKWADLANHRSALMKTIELSAEKGVPASVIAQDTDIAEGCEDETQLSDVENHIRLACDAAAAAKALEERDGFFDDLENDSGKEGLRRRPRSRANRYGEYYRKGYGRLAEKFGISATQFADNMEGALQYGESYQLHVPKDSVAPPLEMAEFVGQELAEQAENFAAAAASAGRTVGTDALIETEPERLLEAAAYMLTHEILADPRVRQAARRVLELETAMVSTTPSERGILEVDSSHPLRPVMTIKDKPVRAFAGSTEFALIRKAESKGYATMSVRFSPEQEAQLSGFLVSAATVSVTANSPLIELWNAERRKLATSVCNGLIPRLIVEATDSLQRTTDICLRQRLMNAASRRMLQGPARPFVGEDGAPKVMAICVTSEEDEDPDPAQAQRDADEAKAAPGSQPYKRPKGARITFVNLDVNGEFVSSNQVFGYWLRRPISHRSPPEEIAKRIRSYLVRCKPQVVAIGVGSGGKDAVRLKCDISEIVRDMVKTKSAAFMIGEDATEAGLPDENSADLLTEKHVIVLSEDVARVYCETGAADIALPVDGMTLVEKRAIALGRMAQEPLGVYAGIGAEPDVAAKLEFHPLHYMVSVPGRVESYRRALIRAVCTNGVDVNRALLIPHLQPMMSFLGGLGPRKATELIVKLEQYINDEGNDDSYLPSRKHLYANHFMGRVVFLSCAGFLRVRDPALHPGGSTVEAVKERKARLERTARGRRRDESSEAESPLDDSRIHPENYAVALKIADEALRDENGQLRVDLSEASSMSETSRIIAAVLDNPEGLSQLDLEQYANHLENLGRGRLYETIKMIATEFQHPFKDYRVPLRNPGPEAQFYLSIGADPSELRVGAEITATSCRVGNNGTITCRLPYVLNGVIFSRNFSDEDQKELKEDAIRRLVSDGSDIPCRILGFEFDRFQVQLTSKPSCLANPRLIPTFRMSYDPSNEYILEYPVVRGSGSGLVGDTASRAHASSGSGAMSEEARLRARSALLRSRAKEVVSHDFFRDIESAGAIEALRNAGPGEVIIRPSGKGKDQFVFTAKFADFQEGNKDAGRGVIHVMCEVQNPLSKTGETRYIVGEEPYSSVDEVLERFVLPVVTNMGEALRHRKFRPLNEADVVKLVKEAKREAPSAVPYYFGLADNKPLYLTLVYIPGSKTVQQELIKVVPDGYHFRNVLHATLDLLSSWFKKNMRSSTGTVRPTSVRGPANASPYVGTGMATKATAAPFISKERPTMPIVSSVATPLIDDAPPKMPTEHGILGVHGSGNGHALRPDSAFPGDTRLPFGGARSPMPPVPSGPDIPRLLPQDAPPPMPPTLQPGDVGLQRPVPFGPGGPDQRAPPNNIYPQQPYLGDRVLGVLQPPMADGFVNGDGWGTATPEHGRGDILGHRRDGPPFGGVPPPARVGSGLDQRPPARLRPGSPTAAAAHSRRGQMPIPAWKKAQQEQQNG